MTALSNVIVFIDGNGSICRVGPHGGPVTVIALGGGLLGDSWSSFGVSPDGTTIVAWLEFTGGESSRTLWRMNADGSNRKQITSLPADFLAYNDSFTHGLTFSPDGSMVVADYGVEAGEPIGYSLVHVDNFGHVDVPVPPDPDTATGVWWTTVYFSPDGNRIAYEGRDYPHLGDNCTAVIVCNVDGSGREIWAEGPSDTHGYSYQPYGWLDNDRLLVRYSSDTVPGDEIFIMDATTRTSLYDDRVDGAYFSESAVALSPDNSKLAVCCVGSDSFLRIFDIATGEFSAPLTGAIDNIFLQWVAPHVQFSTIAAGDPTAGLLSRDSSILGVGP